MKFSGNRNLKMNDPLSASNLPAPSVTASEVSARIGGLMQSLRVKNRGDMAEKLGYSRSQLYAIERGEVPISRKFLISLESLERTAGTFQNPEPYSAADPIMRLLRGLDFVSLCGVAESGITKLRQAGKVIPEEVKHLSLAVEEIQRRASLEA